jgi:hypothetical protein
MELDLEKTGPSRKAEAGAPRPEVKITPEMLEAGADVIQRAFNDVIPWGSETAHEAAIAVYQAMELRRRG